MELRRQATASTQLKNCCSSVNDNVGVQGVLDALDDDCQPVARLLLSQLVRPAHDLNNESEVQPM